MMWRGRRSATIASNRKFARATISDVSEVLAADDPFVDRVREALKRKRSYSVEALADLVDASPRRVREAIDALRSAGFRIPPEQDGEVRLEKVAPSKTGPAHRALLDGDDV